MVVGTLAWNLFSLFIVGVGELDKGDDAVVGVALTAIALLGLCLAIAAAFVGADEGEVGKTIRLLLWVLGCFAAWLILLLVTTGA